MEPSSGVDPASARLVAEWGCDKTNNSYVPFASRRADELKLRSAARQATRERIELEQADSNRRHAERSRVVLEHAAATVRNTVGGCDSNETSLAHERYNAGGKASWTRDRDNFRDNRPKSVIDVSC